MIFLFLFTLFHKLRSVDEWFLLVADSAVEKNLKREKASFDQHDTQL